MSLPATIPVRRDPPSAGDDGSGWSAMAGITLVLVVAVFAWAWWRGKRRRAGAAPQSWLSWLPTPASGPMVRGTSMRLTPKHTVHEIEWEGRKLLVGCSEHGMSLLAEVGVAKSAPTGLAAVGEDAK